MGDDIVAALELAARLERGAQEAFEAFTGLPDPKCEAGTCGCKFHVDMVPPKVQVVIHHLPRRQRKHP